MTRAEAERLLRAMGYEPHEARGHLVIQVPDEDIAAADATLQQLRHRLDTRVEWTGHGSDPLDPESYSEAVVYCGELADEEVA